MIVAAHIEAFSADHPLSSFYFHCLVLFVLNLSSATTAWSEVFLGFPPLAESQVAWSPSLLHGTLCSISWAPPVNQHLFEKSFCLLPWHCSIFLSQTSNKQKKGTFMQARQGGSCHLKTNKSGWQSQRLETTTTANQWKRQLHGCFSQTKHQWEQASTWVSLARQD